MLLIRYKEYVRRLVLMPKPLKACAHLTTKWIAKEILDARFSVKEPNPLEIDNIKLILRIEEGRT